jgi:Na+/H+ antiporter NhaD/arsenite permease-like protein
MSPIADNLTTALVMGAVVLAVGAGNARFISIAFVNIVVAANAGGAFSPFGDITTLMVWQKGLVDFQQFFSLFLPSLVNFLIPAGIMHFAIKNEKPKIIDEQVDIKMGGVLITFMFLLTIATAVSFHNFLHLPPAMGMMNGLGYLMVISYFVKRGYNPNDPISEKFDIFKNVSRAEWDTLLFFFGVIVSVGGLGFMGYLALVSEAMYVQLGATYANVLVGILSAIVDNIPVMFAVLTMTPDMSLGQWLLVTLTAGVGGSLLSIGSAAGVALMGQSKGYYTFVSHLKWIWAIALGYAASILVHLWINSALFDVPI